jgi:Uma2 family endonuclease
MAAMTRANAATYRDAVAHLPPDGTLILNGVTWDEYESLADHLGDHSPVRITYDQGRLEVMSPSTKHEKYSDMVTYMLRALAGKLGRPLESFGRATFKQQWLDRGVEPDACFYVENAASVATTEEIDLAKDPPPDIAVEIDISHGSTTKFGIYAGMRVPEVWRYDGRHAQMHIYHLAEQGYFEMTNSLAFPILTADTLSEFLAQSKAQGQTTALESFADWMRKSGIRKRSRTR